MISAPSAIGSASIAAPDYWWYQARARLLQTVLGQFVGAPMRLLDVGSADGPSVRWLRTSGAHVSLDIDPRGLTAGGVCGSALELPFHAGSFDVVAAFDVLEHCDPEEIAVSEFLRVLAPGGRLLLSVPAYNWAWSDFDDNNGHHRRYTVSRAVTALERSGFVVQRATYAFAGVFPFFAAERLMRRVKVAITGRRGALADGGVPALPKVSRPVSNFLLRICGVEQKLLASRDMPYGSSVLIAATKPA